MHTHELKEIIKRFMAERNWLNQPPAEVAKSIVIEGAELLEHFQWTQFFKEEPELDAEEKKEIMEELADVFIYAIEMSIVLDCDIEKIVLAKLEKAAKKYPAAEAVLLGSKSYKGIKKEYRKKNG